MREKGGGEGRERRGRREEEREERGEKGRRRGNVREGAGGGRQ